MCNTVEVSRSLINCSARVLTCEISDVVGDVCYLVTRRAGGVVLLHHVSAPRVLARDEAFV